MSLTIIRQTNLCHKTIQNYDTQNKYDVEKHFSAIRKYFHNELAVMLHRRMKNPKNEILDDYLDKYITETDFLRIVVLPTTLFQLYCDEVAFDSTFFTFWLDKIQHLFTLWLRLTIFDKKLDGEVISPEINNLTKVLMEDLSWDLKGYLEVVEGSYEKFSSMKYNRLADYVYALCDRYFAYGNYISEIFMNIFKISEEEKSRITSFLSNVLVLSQLFDDLADWQTDLKNNSNTYVVDKLRKEVDFKDPDCEINSKKYFLAKVLPENITYIRKHISALNKNRYENKLIDGFTSDFLEIFSDEANSMIKILMESLKKD